jgi:glycosyltransferase involved in cell wall biosynthesis
MKFSIIIPSYNQFAYIEETLINAIELKEIVKTINAEVEILLFDSHSNQETQTLINKYTARLDYVEVKKDKGQYDAINKGIEKCTGDYWTWLNTDDTLDKEGFFKLISFLKQHPETDYVYGSIDYINEKSKVMRTFPSYEISMKEMITKVPGIFQQGSFFRKEFTNKIGLLKDYNCCFDYEYVLRCLKNGAKMKVCNFKVANFRQHTISKTGSLTPMFIREQLTISKLYGRKFWNFLTWFSYLRLVKHKLFPR